LVLFNYLKDYWQCGDLQVMDHNIANVLIADDDSAKDYGESVPALDLDWV
jgi:hypothetical protein